MIEYILLAASSLFVIVDPLAVVPAFLAMTPNDTAEQCIRTARLACCVTASILLLIVALDMVRAQRSRVQETHEERLAGTEKADVAVTPLAIPMLAGPGAISTVILLQNEAKDIPQRIALYGCIVAVSLVSYLILRISARSARWLSPILMSIAIRIMGLLLAAVAIQFMLNAIKAFRLYLIAPPPWFVGFKEKRKASGYTP